MTGKRILSILLSLLMVCSLFTGAIFTSNAAEAGAVITMTDSTQDETGESSEDEPPVIVEPANPYSEAAQLLDKEYAYSGDDLGCTYTATETTFKVWAPTASEVSVKLYSTGSYVEEGSALLGTYAMEKDMDGDKWTGCWTVSIQGDLKNVYYTYSVTNKALVTEVEKTFETIDPYAKAVGVNGKRAMVVDLDSTDPEGWSEDTHVLVDTQTDAVVWELVVRDFSSSETSGVSEANRGKFLAFTEKGTTLNGEGDISTCIDYLKELGITHVQLNPIFDFATVNEDQPFDTQYNWGYDPENYNVPEGSYSSNPYDGNVRITECKQMIQALHEAGIGVIMDVVYNHTYFGTTSNFQQLVPNYYYRFRDNGNWSSASGCGNDTASERAMFRKFMIDSIMYWAEEYHVDGFRFDLMGIHDVETMNLIRAELDKIDPRILMYGEGWNSGSNSVLDETTCTGTETLSATQANAKYLSDRVACFNDEIRNAVKGEVFVLTDKGYAQGNTTDYIGIIDGVRANTTGDECKWIATAPSQTITYSSCHDNHTLYDRLVASVYGKDSEYRQRYNNLIGMNKLAAGMVFTSQGTSFILAGEEMARSKDGVDNSYKSDASLNAIDWTLLTENADLVSYYKGLIDIRKAFAPFTESTNKYADSYRFYDAVVATENEYATSSADEFIYSSDYVAFTVENDTEGQWKEMFVAFNPSSDTQTITIDSDVNEWVVIANETYAGLDAVETVAGNTFEVAGGSLLIAVSKASYDAAGIKSTDGKVIIKHVDAHTGKELDVADIITGAPGTGYQVALPSKDLILYDLDRVDGEVTGKYTQGDTIVSYMYKKYKAPSLLTADVDLSGVVNIKDATAIQKHLADVVKLSAEGEAVADVDYSGTVNVKDATMIQKHLADIDVSVGSVTVNYYRILEDGTKIELAPSETFEHRVGAQYKIKPLKFDLLDINEELSSDNTSGLFPAGKTVVNFYYEPAKEGVRIHVAHLAPALTWEPYLWAWSAKGNEFSSWPGEKLAEGDDGWFCVDTELPSNDYSIIISNNGSPQSADYTGLSGREIWVIIDDYNVRNQGKFLNIYTEEPDLEALRAEAANPAA